MILKIDYLAKFSKLYLTNGFLRLDEKYYATRFSSREELFEAVKKFGESHINAYQYTFTIKEEITIENNNQ